MFRCVLLVLSFVHDAPYSRADGALVLINVFHVEAESAFVVDTV